MYYNYFMLLIQSILTFVTIITTCTIVDAQQQQQQQQRPIINSEPTNHQIRFLGINSDFQNLTQTKYKLETILKNFTKDNIIIDFIDENNVYWHSATISSISDCPEKEIQDLYSSIRAMGPSEETYTREFKLYLTEEFEPPKSVTIEWIGPCGNVGRKRSEPVASSNNNNQYGAGAFMSKNTNQSIDSTTIDVVASTSTTPEPKEPTTTVETPTSTPFISFEPIQNTSSSFGSFFDTDRNSSSFDDAAAPTELSTESSTTEQDEQELIATTTNQPELTTTTTTTITSTTREESEPVVQNASNIVVPIFDTLDKNSSSSDDTPPAELSTELSTEPSTESSSTEQYKQELIVSTTNQPESTTTTIKSISGEQTEHHYGKYVGLTAGFLLVVGYVVCSRAYRRQSQMYELHND